MENISSVSTGIPTTLGGAYSKKAPVIAKINTAEQVADVTSKTPALLQDHIEISDASRKKLSESQKEDQEQEVVQANNVKPQQEVEAENNTATTDIDKEIRKLSSEILKLTVEVELLRSKEDIKSAKEMQKLETELALKKGMLEAAIDRKSQMITA